MKILLSKSFVPTLALLAFFAFAKPTLTSAQQAPSNPADPAQIAAKMAGMTREWMDSKNTTPGISVDIRPVSRSNDGGHLTVQYHVFVTGAPKDQNYSLVTWPINAREPSVVIEGMSIGAEGVVVCAGRSADQCGDPNKKDDPVEFTFLPVLGEVCRMAMVSADTKTKIFFAVVPDPIIGRDKSCSLEVVRLMPNFELALVRGKGFQPNEDLQLQSKSYDEAHDNKVKADANGVYFTALLPFVKDKQNGKTNVQLKSGDCSPQVSFEWGK
jgi:hypothetical protein